MGAWDQTWELLLLISHPFGRRNYPILHRTQERHLNHILLQQYEFEFDRVMELKRVGIRK